MRTLRLLALAGLVAFVAACDEDDPAPGTVQVTVTADGTGLAGITVSIGAAGTTPQTTDASGAVTFNNVPSGSYTVSITGVSADYACSSTTQPVTVAGGQTTSISFSCSTVMTSSITGSVTRADGAPQPGASVTITRTGGTAQTVTTGAGGNYSLTGLQSGTYSVTLAVTANCTDAEITQSVTVAAGQAGQANFTCTIAPPTEPATVTIQSINSVATGTPLDANNVFGTVNVDIGVQEGDDEVTRIEVYMDDPANVIYTQNIASGDAEGPELADFDVIATIPLAGFDMATGEPDFSNVGPNANGTHTLGVSAFIQGTTARGASAETDIRLTNQDKFVATRTADNTAADVLARNWDGNGDYIVNLIAVLYSEMALGSATVAWAPSGGGGQIAAPDGPQTETDQPFSFTFENDGYQTDPGSGIFDQVMLQGATYSDGSVVLLAGPDGMFGTGDDGQPTPVLTNVRWDEVDPVPGTFVLNERLFDSTDPCCTNNWINADYVFADGLAGQSDTGVGLNGTIIEADGDAVTTGADLAASAVNTEYEMTANINDRVGNNADAVPTASGSNMLTAGDLLVGVDLLAPTDEEFAGTSEDDLTVYNTLTGAPAGGILQYDFSAVDDAAGFGANPVDLTFTQTTADDVDCLVGDGDDCDPVARPLANPLAVPGDGLFDVWGTVRDQGGNPSATTLWRRSYNDQTVPIVSNIVLPTANPIPGGTSQQFSAVLEDELGVGSSSFGIVFGGAAVTLPFSVPQVFSTPFDDMFITEQQVLESIIFTPSIEVLTTTAMSSASGAMSWAASAARLIGLDAAGNASTQNNTFAAGTVVPATRITNRLPGGGTELFEVVEPAAAVLVCNGGGVDECDEEETVTLEATITGASGVLNNPFAGGQFYFMREDAAGVLHIIGQAGAPSVSDDGATRTWTFTFEWNPGAEVGVEVGVEVYAVGVESNGHVVRSIANTNVEIVLGTK